MNGTDTQQMDIFQTFLLMSCMAGHLTAAAMLDRSETRRRLSLNLPQCSTHHPYTPANPIIPTLAARNYERADAELKLIPRLSICSRKASTSRQRSLQAAHAAMSEEYVHTSGCSPPACNCCIMSCAFSKFPARAAGRLSKSLRPLLATEARQTKAETRARTVQCLTEQASTMGTIMPCHEGWQISMGMQLCKDMVLSQPCNWGVWGDISDPVDVR